MSYGENVVQAFRKLLMSYKREYPINAYESTPKIPQKKVKTIEEVY